MTIDTVSGNKLIAEFDGWDNYIIEKGLSKGMVAYCNDSKKKYRYPIESMKYHTSWDWLMPVVEKIALHKFEDGDTSYLRTFGLVIQDDDEKWRFMVRFNRFALFSSESFIESAWLAVVDFIEWHNKNKKA